MKKAPISAAISRLARKPEAPTERKIRKFEKGYYSATHRIANSSAERILAYCRSEGISAQVFYDRAVNMYLASVGEPALDPTPPFHRGLK